ncbi:MAG TPA: CHRD domain-containing protein [Phycisphaerales bacterium]|nr:CHRD domain-containing protein [Phycisphaerales bacterium]
MNRVAVCATALAASFGLAALASADIVHLRAIMNGPNEVPGPGDPDGTGVADLFIDTAATPNPSVNWIFTAQNIALPLTGAHIHQAPAGVAGGIVVDFNSQFTGFGLQDPDLNNVLANPAGFYVNLHNSPFPSGAIRGQLALVPAPGAAALLLLGGAAAARRRR